MTDVTHHEREVDDMCVEYLTVLCTWLDRGGPPPVASRDYGWLDGAAHMLVTIGVAPAPADEAVSLLYTGWHALQRPGVADRMMGGGDDLPLARLCAKLLDRWDAHDWSGDQGIISSSEAAEILGLATANAATNQLRRWGVPTAPRGAGQGRESRYYRAAVEAAQRNRAGRGARTDLRRES